MNIVVIGVGYVGLVTGLSLVRLGNKITFLDTDLSKIQMLNQKSQHSMNQSYLIILRMIRLQRMLLFASLMMI